MDVNGAICIVTGGSEGIGLAITRRLVRKGAKVMIGSRNERVARAAIEKLVEDLSVPTENLAFHRTDVQKIEDSKALFDATLARFGNCDVVVANAGFSAQVPFIVDIANKTDIWVDATQANLIGTMALARVACSYWCENKRAGAFVMTGSVAGYFPVPGHACAATAVSKAGLNQFAHVLQYQLDVYGVPRFGNGDVQGKSTIRINTVNPGFTFTSIYRKMLGDKLGSSPETVMEALKRDPHRLQYFESVGGWTPIEKLVDAYMHCIEDASVRGTCFMVAGSGGKTVEYPDPSLTAPGGSLRLDDYVSM